MKTRSIAAVTRRISAIEWAGGERIDISLSSQDTVLFSLAKLVGVSVIWVAKIYWIPVAISIVDDRSHTRSHIAIESKSLGVGIDLPSLVCCGHVLGSRARSRNVGNIGWLQEDWRGRNTLVNDVASPVLPRSAVTPSSPPSMTISP